MNLLQLAYNISVRLISRIAIIILILMSANIPINDLIRSTCLIVASAIIFFSNVTTDIKKIAICFIIALSSYTINHYVSYQKIPETHNIYLDNYTNNLQNKLPVQVFKTLNYWFITDNPIDTRCDKSKYGCWAYSIAPKKLAAFSADDIYAQNQISRRVFTIDFHDISSFRLGDINSSSYDWFLYGDIKDDKIKVLKRDSAPFFVSYTISSSSIDSNICWKGLVFWQNGPETYNELSNQSESCKRINAEDIGKKIFGISMPPSHPLSMLLEKSFFLSFLEFIEKFIGSISILLITFILFEFNSMSVFAALSSVITLYYLVIRHASWFSEMPVMDGGNDGLVHLGFSRNILHNILELDIITALRGGESVFYYMPGLRFFRAIELLVFGDGLWGYIIVMSFLPFFYFVLVFNLWRSEKIIIQTIISSILLIIFIFGLAPLTTGIWFEVYVLLAHLGYAEPLGALFFIIGLYNLINEKDNNGNFTNVFYSGLFFALSSFIRPNFAIGAIFAGMALIYGKNFNNSLYKIVIFLFGFTALAFLPLHNLIFGNKFVLFTSAATIPDNLAVQPYIYLYAIKNFILSGNDANYLQIIKIHFLEWFGKFDTVDSIFKLLCLISVISTLLEKNISMPLRILAASTFGLQVVFLFYSASGRYSYLAWMLGFLTLTRFIWEFISNINCNFYQKDMYCKNKFHF